MLLFPDGYYIYHECDNVSNGQKARLLSPAISTPASKFCVQFRYFMYGSDGQNVLRVLLKTPSEEVELWKKIGIQSPSWLEGSITISKPSGQSINVSATTLPYMLLYHSQGKTSMLARIHSAES